MGIFRNSCKKVKTRLLSVWIRMRHHRVAPCPVCGDPAASPYYRNLLRNGQQTLIYRCPACSHKFCYPLPDKAEISSWYQGMSYFHQNCNHQGIVSMEPSEAWSGFLTVRNHAFKCYVIEGYGLNHIGTVAEVGCLEGAFLADLFRQGYQVTGFETNAEVAENGSRSFGIPILVNNIEAEILPEAAYDVVCSFHTLEHLCDPLVALKKIWAALRPGGVVLLELPCDDDEMDNRDHFHFFSNKSLECLVRAYFSEVRLYGQEYLRHGSRSSRSCYITGRKS